MSNSADLIRAKRAKILADAQRQAASLDELLRLAELADQHGFVLVEKAASDAGNDSHIDEIADGINVNGPAYKAAISVAKQAIRQANWPLELSQIYDACVSTGVPLGGKRPQSTLSAYLSHPASTVESIRKGLYWLKDTPLPKEFSATTNGRLDLNP